MKATASDHDVLAVQREFVSIHGVIRSGLETITQRGVEYDHSFVLGQAGWER